MPEIVLISGPQWVPVEYYDYYYRDRVQGYIDDGCGFILGAADGVDTFAQRQLADAGLDSTRVTVYNKGDKDGRIEGSSFCLKNGFENYPDRDYELVKAADEVLCVLPQFGGGCSGSLVSVLGKVLYAPDAALKAIRESSEPYESGLVEQVAAVYSAYYAKKLAERPSKRAKVDDE